ncbi:MAG: DUF1080 domain-containing protein [Pseudomonadota bacterium]
MAHKLHYLASIALFGVLANSPAVSQEDVQPRPPQTAQVESGWRMLFDGKTLNGWRSYGKPAPAEVWSVKNGHIVLEPFKWWPTNVTKRGALMTVDQFTNFELELEWKVSRRANSGLMFGVREVEGARFAHQSGIEIQILDNVNSNVAKKPSHRASAIFDQLPPPVDSTKPVGEFNKVRLRVMNGKVTHTLNGAEMASFDTRSQEWLDTVANSSFKNSKFYGKYETGHIVLQDHLNQVEFRNIRIRELPNETSFTDN